MSRRTFLKLGAAGAVLAAGRLPAAAFGAGFPRIAAARPLPAPHDYFPDPDSLLAWPLDRFDLLLVPAYIAATLIGRGALRPAGGSPGRPHDPEGVYTIPDSYQIAFLRYLEASRPAGVAAWSELRRTTGSVLWPGSGRLAIGAALLGRGYSPNDTHAGHLAQAAGDLARLALQAADARARPLLAQTQAGPRSAALALILADAPLPAGARLPVDGVPLIEYDWVIPATANAALAHAFLRLQGRPAEARTPGVGVRGIPLMPLPEAVRRQHAEIWAALRRGGASAA